MTRPSRKYVLDTQLFIQAFRDAGANESLQEFHRLFAPFEYFSVVVAQELRAGTARSQDRKALEKNVISVFERANRVITPSAGAWHRSGDLLAEMARKVTLRRARCPGPTVYLRPAMALFTSATARLTGCASFVRNADLPPLSPPSATLAVYG